MKRKDAATKIFELQKTLESKPYAFSTVYQRIYRLRNGNWHFLGRAYDYTV